MTFSEAIPLIVYAIAPVLAVLWIAYEYRGYKRVVRHEIPFAQVDAGLVEDAEVAWLDEAYELPSAPSSFRRTT